MSSINNQRVMLALPSKGAIAEPTLEFMKACDLKVAQSNPRQYTATVPALANLDVLLQRVTDIVYKVADGTADLGITGFDVYRETITDSDDVVVLYENLRYGNCQLVLAVPEAWIDVESIADLVDVSLDFREHKRRNLRVATKFTKLARQFLHEHGVHHFTLVEAEGALEAAPTLGYADVIVDLTATGTTLRENHLKPLKDGVILDSNACLIANMRRLRESPAVLEVTKTLLEVIDASLNGKNYYQITANLRGQSAEEVAQKVAQFPVIRGLQGPTVAPIHASRTAEGAWFGVTVVVASKNLMEAVACLRRIGGTQASVVPTKFVFMEESPSVARLNQRLAGN